MLFPGDVIFKPVCSRSRFQRSLVRLLDIARLSLQVSEETHSRHAVTSSVCEQHVDFMQFYTRNYCGKAAVTKASTLVLVNHISCNSQQRGVEKKWLRK